MQEYSMENNKLIFSVLVIVSLVVFLLIAWYTIDILLLTFAGILLAIFLRTLNNLIKRFISLPDSLSLTSLLILIVTFLTITISLIYPLISDQINQLYQDLPKAWNQIIQDLNPALRSLYQRINLQQFMPPGRTIFAQATNLFSTTFGIIGSFLFIIFISIFLAYDPHLYTEGFIQMFPLNKQKKFRDIFDSIQNVLEWWMIGKIVSMSIVGIATVSGLWLLGIPMALTLGILAAILSFIPNFGPVISAIPAVLVAVIHNPLSALYVIILYIVIQAIESYLITPLVQTRTVSLPPALIIFAQFIMAALTGILGLALATPLLAVLSVFTKRLYND